MSSARVCTRVCGCGVMRAGRTTAVLSCLAPLVPLLLGPALRSLTAGCTVSPYLYPPSGVGVCCSIAATSPYISVFVSAVAVAHTSSPCPARRVSYCNVTFFLAGGGGDGGGWRTNPRCMVGGVLCRLEGGCHESILI